MKTKAVVFACLLFVSVVVFVASAVSEGTQEQHEKAEVENGNSVEESKLRCLHGCCRYYRGGCVGCCHSAAEAAQATKQNEGEGEVKTNGFIGGGKGGGKGGENGGK